MKKTTMAAFSAAFALLSLSGFASPAKAQPLKQPGYPTINITPRVFTGAIFVLAGGNSDLAGALEADNPKCVLTVPSNPNGIGAGSGADGVILLNGSTECAGSYELFMSGGNQIGSNTGVNTGTFAIINAKDQTTVEWAGIYTQVMNINGGSLSAQGCAGIDFCANLGSAFGDNTFNGGGLSYLLELNGFTWFVPQHK